MTTETVVPRGFRPLGDRILVRPDKPLEQVGRIIIPKTAKQKDTDRGLVLAVGPGMLRADGRRWPMPCAPGDRILFHGEGAVRVTFDDEVLLLMRDDFVIAHEVSDEAAAQ